MGIEADEKPTFEKVDEDDCYETLTCGECGAGQWKIAKESSGNLSIECRVCGSSVDLSVVVNGGES